MVSVHDGLYPEPSTIIAKNSVIPTPPSSPSTLDHNYPIEVYSIEQIECYRLRKMYQAILLIAGGSFKTKHMEWTLRVDSAKDEGKRGQLVVASVMCRGAAV